MRSGTVCEPRMSKVVHGVNLVEFRARVEEEATARTMFYDSVDAGQMPHLAREWTLAPVHVRQLYLSLARSVHRCKVAMPVVKPPTRWYHQLFARFVGGHA